MCKFRVLVLESFIVQATLKYSYTAYVYAPEIKVQKDVMFLLIWLIYSLYKGMIKYFPLSSLLISKQKSQ